MGGSVAREEQPGEKGMADDDSIDLFGDISAEEQRAIDALAAKRREEQAEHFESQESAQSLDFQRWRYLSSDKELPGTALPFDTLKGREPTNLGPAFTGAELCEILASVRTHVAQSDWSTQRHSAFPTQDIPVRDLPISKMVTDRLERLLFPKLEEHTGIQRGYWAFRDLFIIGYHADRQRALEAHTDGCLASLTLLLNDPGEFEGGGTYFEKFKLHVMQSPGDAWIHDANLQHSGVAISRGTRIIMVAFMDTVGGMTDVLSSGEPPAPS
ncbi:hypothetical protein GQ54DRAFT_295443 [Martensiomyces pterosporus]|nr:hypothetical protein GQ54DRAFT_295443 [Martensiomyces pterosporus]